MPFDASFIKVLAGVACLGSFLFTLVAVAALAYHWMRLLSIPKALLAIAVYLGVSGLLLMMMITITFSL